MPTLLLQDGFKFFFYANEHLPMHVHVCKAGSYLKINLATMEVVECFMKTSELKSVMAITMEHRAEFVRKWNEFFNKR